MRQLEHNQWHADVRDEHMDVIATHVNASDVHVDVRDEHVPSSAYRMSWSNRFHVDAALT